MIIKKSSISCSILGLMLVLTACQPKNENKNNGQAPDEVSASDVAAQQYTLEGETQRIQVMMPDCKGQNCPEFNVDRLQTNQFALDHIIDEAILDELSQYLEIADQKEQIEQSQPKNQTQHATSATDQLSASQVQTGLAPSQAMVEKVQPFLNSFIGLDKELKALGVGHQISLNISPKIINGQGPLTTVVMNSSNYLGGAHGSSAQKYFNFDVKHQKQIFLKDILLPNQKEHLNTIAHDAFKFWVKDSQLADNVDEYEQAWKFKLSENFYLAKNGLILQYGEYEIGPYVVGLPRLVIPYTRLKGVIKPEFIPQDQTAQSAASQPQA